MQTEEGIANSADIEEVVYANSADLEEVVNAN